MRPLTIERHPTNELSQSNSMNSQATIQSTAAAPCAIHRSYLTPLKFQQFGVDKLSELPRCLFVCPQCAAQVIRKLDAALGLADFDACRKQHVAALLALEYLVEDGHDYKNPRTAPTGTTNTPITRAISNPFHTSIPLSMIFTRIPNPAISRREQKSGGE